MTFPKPTDLIAHRDPFIFVDEITELTPGISASTIWKLTGDEWFFAGHFPGRPTLPGVLMCEAIAQTGALAIVSDPKFAMASHINTPGSVGRPGKCPAKNHSSPVNFQIVDAEMPGVSSVISSTKMNG